MRNTLFLFGITLASSAWAQDAPRFRVHFPGVVLEDQTLTQLDDGGSIYLKGKDDTIRPCRDLVSLRRPDHALPDLPAAPYVHTTCGDWLALARKANLRLVENRLWLQLTEAVQNAKVRDLGVPWPYLSLLALGEPHGEESLEVMRDQLLKSSRHNDVVLLKSGDRLEGRIRKLEGSLCQIEGTRSLQLTQEELAWIAGNPDRLATPRPKKITYHLVLTGGSRLALEGLRLDQKRQLLSGTALFGGTMEVPLADVLALDVRQARAASLSDLVAKSYLHTPLAGPSWPLGRDQGLRGRPLRSKLGTHDKGLALFPSSRVSFALAGKKWFETSISLDDSAGPADPVTVVIEVDGRPCELPNKGLVVRGDLMEVRLEVASGSELTLRVSPSGRSGIQSQVNFLDARLIE